MYCFLRLSFRSSYGVKGFVLRQRSYPRMKKSVYMLKERSFSTSRTGSTILFACDVCMRGNSPRKTAKMVSAAAKRVTEVEDG